MAVVGAAATLVMTPSGVRLLPVQTATYRPHSLHRTDRVWSETNCYVDVWVEVLHALGLDPLAAAAFPVSTDFEGDQWTFYKYPPEDLLATYGIDVHEMNPWMQVADHVEEQLGMGRLLTVEVDSWFLPDTHGVAYRRAHVKSTIVPNALDREGRRLGYFHNAGYFELEGDDFDGVFRLDAHADADALAPYVELVRLDRIVRAPEDALTANAHSLLCSHVARRPPDNPMARLEQRMRKDLTWLSEASIEAFHVYAFATCRQCGAAAETAAAFCRWLGVRTPGPQRELEEAATQWQSIAESAKSLQMKLARAARGRTGSLDDVFASMASAWCRAQELLDRVAPPA